MVKQKFTTPYILMFAPVLVGFALRLIFITRNIFHPDEFISLLAITRILEAGVPYFPSGQLYDHGLLFSYLSAGFVAIANSEATLRTVPGETIARWVSLLFSVLSISLIFQLGQKMFRATAIGIFAALIMALYPQAILWGGRIRMYSLAQFLYLLALLLIWLGYTRANRPLRLAGYGALFSGLFTHLALILTVPPLALAWLTSAWSQRRFHWRILQQKAFWLEVAFATLLLFVALYAGQNGFIAGYSANTSVEQTGQAASFGTIIASVIKPSSFNRAFESFAHYFSETENAPLAILATIGLLALTLQYGLKRAGEKDAPALFIALLFLGLIFEFSFVLGGKWRNGRYYFILISPLLTLLAGYGLTQMVVFLQIGADRLWSGKIKHLAPLILFTGVTLWIAITLLNRSNHVMAEDFKKYRYDLAWRYVSQKTSPNDTTLASWPSAAYLYKPPLDFYANQKVPVVMFNKSKGYLTDKYAGARYIGSVAELNALLDKEGQTWFVVEHRRLFNFFEPDFVQQVFQQMTTAKSYNNVHVLVEKEDRWPLAEKPAQSASTDLSGQLVFKGYTLRPTSLKAGQPGYLTLFWQPISPVFNYKIFVHLRNASGETVAQADFLPLEGATVDLKGWTRREGSDEILRTGTILRLPADLPAGTYTLWAGMYKPITFERLPVTNDTSGENAIRLGNVIVY